MTVRARPEIPSLRSEATFVALRQAIAAASGEQFRVVHLSAQDDHVHAIVEAVHKTALSRGISGLLIRAARAINRTLRRHGSVWSGRYHARALTTPRETRAAILYVLQNWKKHMRGARGIDARSSAPWFDGWSPDPEPGSRRSGGDCVAAGRSTRPRRQRVSGVFRSARMAQRLQATTSD